MTPPQPAERDREQAREYEQRVNVDEALFHQPQRVDALASLLAQARQEGAEEERKRAWKEALLYAADEVERWGFRNAYEPASDLRALALEPYLRAAHLAGEEESR